MTFVYFLIGILIPTLIGWLLLGLAEGKSPVLGRLERCAWALILGPTLTMLVVFIVHVLGLTNLNLAGYLVPSIAIILILGGLCWWRSSFPHLTPVPSPAYAGEGWPRESGAGVRWAAWILLAWTILKLVAGAYDLAFTPTYWDDSFNNWNMRAKMFYIEEKIVLEIPTGNGAVQTAQGVSSYPPTLPMMKSWLATLNGEWSEPLVNGMQVIWILGLALALFCALRRIGGRTFGILGVYALVSLPLILIHASNPYAEIFLASHLFLAVTSLYFASNAESPESNSWLRLFGISLGLLLFTKNEAMAIYAPILVVLFVWMLWQKKKSMKTIAVSVAPVAVFGLPWLLFKWMNGLTFGNAKAVGTAAIGFSQAALEAIWFSLTHEPNWLFLPFVLLVLLILTGKKAFKHSLGILTWFVLAAAAFQMLLFIFIAPLATEAIMQTGLSRGITQIAPVAALLAMMLGKTLLRESSSLTSFSPSVSSDS